MKLGFLQATVAASAILAAGTSAMAEEVPSVSGPLAESFAERVGLIEQLATLRTDDVLDAHKACGELPEIGTPDRNAEVETVLDCRLGALRR